MRDPDEKNTRYGIKDYLFNNYDVIKQNLIV